jgi:hypothetical protein
VKVAALGLALTAVVSGIVGALWGSGALIGSIAFGLLATAIQVAAHALVRPAVAGPFKDLLRRWGYGMALRVGGIGLFGVAVWIRRDVFLPLPSAIGFLGVLVPLLFTEIRLFR